MDPMNGEPGYGSAPPEQGAGGACGICGRPLPPPDLEAVAASIDQTLSMEAGRMVPRTAWAGKPPDGVMDSLLFWMPSVKENRRLWERGQALWTEQMTAALSGPCESCAQAGAGYQGAPPPPGATMIQTPDPTGEQYGSPTPGMHGPEQGPAPASTVMMGQGYADASASQMPPTATWSPASAAEPGGSTAAMPSYPEMSTTAAPIQPHEDPPTSAAPLAGSSFGAPPSSPPPSHDAEPPTAAADLSEPQTQAAPIYEPQMESDEHESHTVILSSLPSLRTTTRLVVVEGPVHGRQFSLGRDRTTIGRSIGCHVTVEADSVGYDHARVVRAGGAWQLEVAASGGEVFVNDDRVDSSRTLRHGDVIRIGPARLRFESGS